MTPKELAGLMNGREIYREMTDAEDEQAKESGVVAVFGYSDDAMSFRGAIRAMMDCYEGGTAYLNESGLLKNRCGRDCPYHAEEMEKARWINAVWNKDGYSWVYETKIPHITFDILEDGEPFCRGIAFYLADAAATVTTKPSGD